MLLISIMLGVAVLAGAVAVAVVARHPALDPAAPRAAEPAARALEHGLERRGPLARVLRSRLDAREATGLLLTVALVVAAVLGILVYQVRSNSGIVSLDRSIEHWADSHATATSRDVLRVVTDLGATVVVLGIGALVALVERRRFRDHNTPFRNVALYLLLVIAGQWIVTQLIKLGVGRTRPVLGVAAGLDGSFPSGHSAAAAATFAACALVLGMARSHRAQMALTGAAVAIAAAVASCRVLLGLHWFSDVVGGLALGWAWFAVVSLAFGGRLLRFGAPVELGERHDALRQLEVDGAGGSDAGAGEQVRPAAGRRPPG